MSIIVEQLLQLHATSRAKCVLEDRTASALETLKIQPLYSTFKYTKPYLSLKLKPKYASE